MQVILLEKVQNLGALGDKVNVRPGYGRNFLIPTGKAVPATETNVADFEQRRAELEKAQAEMMSQSASRKAEIDAMGEVTIPCKVSDEGHLFGSVGTTAIAEAIAAIGPEVSRTEIRMPSGSLREVGEFEIGIHLQADVDTTITVKIIAEE